MALGGKGTGSWRCAKCYVKQSGCTDEYGQQQTVTDGYGRSTCWSVATSHITISSASGAPCYLSPVRLQPDDRRNSQRARRVIATLFASFAEEPRQERTDVRNWSGDDRKARESKRERAVCYFAAGKVITPFLMTAVRAKSIARCCE